MNVLVVYYSRTGSTRNIATQISSELNAQIQEIFDLTDRTGVTWYLKAWKDATLKNLTEIKDLNVDILKFDLIIIWTPVWVWTVSTPIRTFLTKYKKFIKQDVAFFCTMWKNWDIQAFQEMETIIWKKPKATLSLTTKQVQKNEYKEKFDKFIQDLKIEK